MMSQDNLRDTVKFDSAEQPSRFFGPAPQPVTVRFGAVSDRGKKRPKNEDHYAVVRRSRSRTVLATNVPDTNMAQTTEQAYVMVVADGIGGEAFGELASMLALQTAWDLAERETCWSLNMNEDQAKELAEKFDAYAQLIHQKLLDHVYVDPKTAGMGTTLTVAYTVGRVAFIGHIGDSRAYAFRDGAVYPLTRDHTLAQELVDAGMESREASKFGHVLTNFLGGRNSRVVTETHQFALQDGDGLLLCSDGLTGHVEEAEIAEAIGGDDDPQKVCQSLLDLALERGGKDNITIVLGRYELPESP
jgi:PPM family protein phosphatase